MKWTPELMQAVQGEPIDGVRVATDFLSSEEEAQSMERIDALRFTTHKEGQSRIGFLHPFPEWIQEVHERLLSENVLQTLSHQMVIIRYEIGSFIQPHIDCPLRFGEQIAGVSLGSESAMHLTCDDRESTIALPRRSVYALSGEARWNAKHATTPSAGRRYSMTFRQPSDDGSTLTPEQRDYMSRWME